MKRYCGGTLCAGEDARTTASEDAGATERGASTGPAEAAGLHLQSKSTSANHLRNNNVYSRSDFGSERFFGDFLFSKATSSRPLGGVLTACSRMIWRAFNLRL